MPDLVDPAAVCFETPTEISIIKSPQKRDADKYRRNDAADENRNFPAGQAEAKAT